MENPANPLEQLIALEQKGRRHIVDLATDEDRREYWRAVYFRVADYMFLLDQGDVAELLTLPPITMVPGTKQWVAGVANVRGQLLPIVNFGQFLFQQPVAATKKTRILVVVHDDVRSGLIVDQVYGMRRFPVDELKPAKTETMPNTLKIMVSGCYEGDEVFHILDVNKLVNETEFMQAAAA